MEKSNVLPLEFCRFKKQTVVIQTVSIFGFNKFLQKEDYKGQVTLKFDLMFHMYLEVKLAIEERRIQYINQ